jgi:hypothetical protein
LVLAFRWLFRDAWRKKELLAFAQLNLRDMGSVVVS